MPSTKPRKPESDRPTPKARAAALRAAAEGRSTQANEVADPFGGVPCPPGFVPYPAHQPQSFMNVSTMIEVEAKRLLQIAQREYFRCTSDLGDFDFARAAEIRAAHRWRLGLDELERLAESRGSWPGNPETRPDPAQKAIANHREAYRAWEPHLERTTEMVTGTPEFDAAEAVAEPARLAEEAAFAKLFEEWPATLSGLLALAEYLPGAVMQNGRSQPDDDGVMALDAVCFVIKNLVRNGRIMASSCPLPAPQPAPFTPADLADACDWAVRQMTWLDTNDHGDDWTDDHTDIELDKNGAVWARAIAEPARNLRDLAAKARMVRHDWLNRNPTDEETGDDCERLTLKVMREVIAFAEDGPADTLADRILTHWREHDAVPDEGPAYDASYEQRWRLLEAADALPATRANIVAKSVALAWLTYAWNTKAGLPRGQCQIDVRLARDIQHAALSEPAPVAAEAAGGTIPPTQPVISGLDIRAQSMAQLLALHGVAGTIGDVAHGMAAQPRSDLRDGSLSAAGRFAYWIAELALEVKDRVQLEARGRTSAPEDEPEHRLMIIAEAIAANGDPVELRAFASDLGAEADRIEARR